MAIQGRNQQQARSSEARPLHICLDCGSKLVHPLDWEAAGPERWNVTLRCPNCEWTASGTFRQAVVDLFDEELDSGVAVLLRDFKELSHDNMRDYVERFVAALAADAIVPEDF